MKEKRSYSKDMMKCIFVNPHKTKVRNEVYLEAIRPYIPYCLLKMSDNDYLPLNRDYKPLGTMRGHHYKYEDYEFLFLNKEEINIEILWDNGKSFGNKLYYFYSDFSSPNRDFQRYKSIVESSIFLVNNNKIFLDFWSYKQSLDAEGWLRNSHKF